MHYLLIDKNPAMVAAWQEYFAEEENVKIVEGDLTDVSCDAIVSPANSFGFMDGGVDYALSIRLGWNLQFELQEAIKALPEGELLVGRAMVIETGDDIVPFLISAPTMRVPMSYNIDTSINAYLAMKATLIQAIQHPQITFVAIPGFCTGVGRMHPNTAAMQMYKAFVEVEKGQKLDFPNFAAAQKQHWSLNPNGKIYS